MAEEHHVHVTLDEGYKCRARSAHHTVVLDEPAALGGTDLGPTPYEMLLSALGACTAITMRMYAQRKGWPLEDVDVRLHHDRIHASDCEQAAEGKPQRMLDRIRREVTLIGPLDDAQRARLIEIAGKCPVHRAIVGEICIDDTFR